MKKTLFLITALLMVSNLWAQDVIVEHPSFRVTNQRYLERQSKTDSRTHDIPAEFLRAVSNLKEDGKLLPMPQYVDGKAILKGQFGDYIAGMNEKVAIYVNNALSGRQEEYTATVNEDGSFTCEIPATHTMQILFRTSKMNNWVFVSPNKESNIYIDLYQQSRNNARLRADKSKDARYIYFAGENAELNNQHFSPEYVDFVKRYGVDYNQMLSDISGMDLEEYKNYHLYQMEAALQALENADYTKKMKEVTAINTKLKTFYWIYMGRYFLEDAFRRANKLDSRAKLVGYTKPEMADDYFNFVKDLPVNDPKSLYSQEYGNAVGTCSMINSSPVRMTYLTNDILKEIEKKSDLSADDKEVLAHERKYHLYENWSADSLQRLTTSNRLVLQKMLDSELLNPEQGKEVTKMIGVSDFGTPQKINSYLEGLMIITRLVQKDSLFQKLELPSLIFIAHKAPSSDSIFMKKQKAFYSKYDDDFKRYYTKQSMDRAIKPIVGILGTDKGILFDILVSQLNLGKIAGYTPLGKSDIAMLAKLDNPFYASYATRLNNALLAKIEEDKKNPYNVYTLPETEEDKILHEIVKPFEGKVILIDFWATWCGPCLSAMKKFAATKKSFSDKDVAFIYLTNQSSPEKTWENMIPGIGGEHYRLKDEQYAYLRKKFGVNGVPSYLILNKKGEKVYFKVGFEGADAIAKILNEELGKQL